MCARHSEWRFIPAGAGNSGDDRAINPAPTVHPRRRGEQIRIQRVSADFCGSSPQARGTVNPNADAHRLDRFIPAGAGNSQNQFQTLSRRPVHPRRRGEQMITSARSSGVTGSSPQARGTVDFLAHLPAPRRFIPAGAGNSPGRACRALPPAVHPRRRGEQRTPLRTVSVSHGSSPQARGTVNPF